MSDDDKESTFGNVFHIPANFMDSGGVIGGMFKMRNLVEACAIFLLLVIIEWNIFSMGLVIKLVLMGITILPCAFVALIGIDGDPLSTFLYHVIKFEISKRNMHLRRVGDYARKNSTTSGNGTAKNKNSKEITAKNGRQANLSQQRRKQSNAKAGQTKTGNSRNETNAGRANTKQKGAKQAGAKQTGTKKNTASKKQQPTTQKQQTAGKKQTVGKATNAREKYRTEQKRRTA